jgi:hypothetical protein
MTLEDGATSFYKFIASAADLVPVFFGLASIFLVGTSLYRLYQHASDAGDAMGSRVQGSVTGQVIALCLGSLLGIGTVVVYWVSSIWTGG